MMLNTEKKIIHWTERHSDVLFLIIVSILGLCVRFVGKDFVSGDASGFLLPWYEEIKEKGGFSALTTQTGDYNIPYQIWICIMTYLPFEPLYLYKALSIVFDYILAFSCALFVFDLNDRTSRNAVFLTYTVILFMPTVVLNSSVWAQCDSIYTSFLVLSADRLYCKKYIPSFLFLGVAFAFKFQAVFVIPFYLYVWIREKKFSILQFFWIAVVDYIMCIPAFLQGRSQRAVYQIYFSQMGTYETMAANFPSFWNLVGNDYETLSRMAIILTFAILGIMLFILMSRQVSIEQNETWMLLLCWSVWTCILFLPSMHERYAYVLDAALLVLALVKPKYSLFFVLAEMVSCMTYGNFLFDLEELVSMQILSMVYTAVYLAFTCCVLMHLLGDRTSQKKMNVLLKNNSGK